MLVLPYSSQLAWRSYLRVIYGGGPYKAHDLLRVADLRTQHLVLGFCLFICGSSLSDYRLEYYNTLSRVSTALWVITRTYSTATDIEEWTEQGEEQIGLIQSEWLAHTRAMNKAGEIQWRLRKELEPEFLTQVPY